MAGLRNAVQGVDIRLYRNGNDIVPTVPWPAPLPFRQVVQSHAIGISRLNPIIPHEIENYIATLAGMEEMRAAAE